MHTDPLDIISFAGAGEVHLETIIKDLKERFARVDIRVSPPLVAFRESVYIEEEAPEPQHKPAKVQNTFISSIIRRAPRHNMMQQWQRCSSCTCPFFSYMWL